MKKMLFGLIAVLLCSLLIMGVVAADDGKDDEDKQGKDREDKQDMIPIEPEMAGAPLPPEQVGPPIDEKEFKLESDDYKEGEYDDEKYDESADEGDIEGNSAEVRTMMPASPENQGMPGCRNNLMAALVQLKYYEGLLKENGITTENLTEEQKQAYAEEIQTEMKQKFEEKQKEFSDERSGEGSDKGSGEGNGEEQSSEKGDNGKEGKQEGKFRGFFKRMVAWFQPQPPVQPVIEAQPVVEQQTEPTTEVPAVQDANATTEDSGEAAA